MKECTGNKACDCAKKAMSEGANRNWVESIEDDCKFINRKAMKTIRLAITDNKDFRLVNVELPEEPDCMDYDPNSTKYMPSCAAFQSANEEYNVDHSMWEENIKRLVDSCPVVSDSELAKKLILNTDPLHVFGGILSYKAEIKEYEIYSIPCWQAEVKEMWDLESASTVQVAILSKSESEEKEEPNKGIGFNKISDLRIYLLNHPDKEMVRSSCLHYLGDRFQSFDKAKNDLFMREEVREEKKKSFQAGRLYEEHGYLKQPSLAEHLKENGF